MAAPSDNDGGDSAEPTDSEDQSFELPLPDEGGEGRQLRRGLFGFKATDVRRQISVRDAELAELRRDVAALWLAFGQHERTIRQVLETLERTSGVALDPPGGRAGQGAGAEASPLHAQPGPDDPAGPDAAAIGAQLSDLDHVLAAIEQATQTLERGYVEGAVSGGDAPDEVEDEVEPQSSPESKPESEPKPETG